MTPQRSAPPPGRRQPGVPVGAAAGGHASRARAGPAQASTRAEAERDALVSVAATAAKATRLEDVVEVAARSALEGLGHGVLSIGAWDREEDVMRIIHSAGAPEDPPDSVRPDAVFALDRFPTIARLLTTATPQFVTVDDPDASPAGVAVLRASGMRSSIGVPIVVDGEPWGGIWAASPINAPSFHARDVRFLETIAGQLAAVVERADRFSDVSRLAYEDPLTGLANRRSLEEALDQAIATYSATGGSVSLLVCDVDNLKAINDERGHQAGDRALRRVAEALVAAASAHPTATVARLSGDEFAILLDGHSASVARNVATAALKLLSQGRDVPVSLSCGVAPASPRARTPSALLSAADTAQYAAKRRGGDQVCTADTSEVAESPGPRRRAHRRSLGDRLERRSADLLHSLDTDYRDAATIDRLEVVTAGFAETLNAAAWTISFGEHGSGTIRSVCTAENRDQRLRGIRVSLGDDVYALSDYPLTEELVREGAGTFEIVADDRHADPAERKLLTELGFLSVMATVVSDADGAHLLELYGDGDSGDLAASSLRLQLLARAAAGRSAGTTARVAQFHKRTQQLSVAAALGTRLATLTDPSQIVDVTLDSLYVLGFGVCAVDRVTPDGRLELVGARGGPVQRLMAGSGWSQPVGLGLTGRAVRELAVVVSGDVRREPDYRLTAETSDTRSELCLPLRAAGDVWGVIDLQDPRINAYDEDDVQVVELVADQVSAALHSAALFSRLEEAYLGTAESLVAALGSGGHQPGGPANSIGEHAEAVGRSLELGSEDLENLRFAAALHDIGKLAVAPGTLGKPGPLTPEERESVEQHPLVSEQLLSPIEFLAGVLPLVRASHERWDGGGYPDGLAGQDIPLGARIILACDAYDAMTSDRPYRAALGHEAALAELTAHAGTQFDPTVVDALLATLGAQGRQGHAVAAS